MAWEFENGRPIYTQLLELIEQKIVAGEYAPGSKMPSVRELAAEAAVNPNTMQRAMVELENNGLIITNRTSGRTVTEDTQVLSEIKKQKANILTTEYVTKMTELGFSHTEIIKLIGEVER